MEDRLLRLLDTEQLSSSKFADVIGVQRSSVSHILTGRNKPSFDFLQKTLKAFPMLNADWLILGEGEMYEGAHGPGGGSLFDQPTVPGSASGSAITRPDEGPNEQSLSGTASEAHISAHEGGDTGNSEAKTVPYPGDVQLTEQQQGRSASMEQPYQRTDHQRTDQQLIDQQRTDQQQGERQVSQQEQVSSRATERLTDQPQGRQQQSNHLTDQQQMGQSAHDKSTAQQHRGQYTPPGPADTGIQAGPSPGSVVGAGKKVRRVILFYDDNSFDAYEQA